MDYSQSSAGGPLQPPQSMADVERLVKRLWEPNPPAQISQINSQLLELQLSQDGWQLADELMASDDANVRFFAALTFTVKLNHDGLILDAESAETIQARLVSWMVRLVRQGEIKLVLVKLCATLATYYLRTPVQWARPLHHVALCFQHGDFISHSVAQRTDVSLTEILTNLDVRQLTVLTWLSASLADDVVKVDSNTPDHARLHREMETSVQDASSLMMWCLREHHDNSLRASNLQCFMSWVNYAQLVWSHNPDALQHLRELIAPAAGCFADEGTVSEALVLFRDTLESYFSFFRPNHVQLLAEHISNYVRPTLERALAEKDSDTAAAYGQLVVAFGTANVQNVVECPDEPHASAAIVKLHLDILGAEGVPGDEDNISVQTIEFWNTYIEHINDELFSNDGEPEPLWVGRAKLIVSQAIELLWRKMWLPSDEIAQHWGDSESRDFKEFRSDASDFILSVSLFLGPLVLRQLRDFALQSLQVRQWRAVEAAIFCLNVLAENVLDDEESQEIAAEVFRSSLFREATDFSQSIPSQARRTVVDMLGSYGEYIQRRPEFLPDTVRFLFSTLETPGLAENTAKSIETLCSTCRASLTPELPGFIDQYQRFLKMPTSQPYAKEKVIGAVAAIVQALQPESAKGEPLLALLATVEKDIKVAKHHAAAGDEKKAEVYGVTGLKCLANMGKALQAPDDEVNIYDDDRRGSSDEPNYWHTEAGQVVQQRIVGCFSALQVVGQYHEAVEAVCAILRCGFTETAPGPFVLPLSVCVRFLQQCTISTPSLDGVLSSAGTMIIQHTGKDAPRIDEEVASVYTSVHNLIGALGEAKEDPLNAMACIEVLSRMIPAYAHVLFNGISTIVLDFTLSAIDGPDQFPKRSACEFWAKVIKPRMVTASGDIAPRVAEVVSAYGPRFANCLLRQIGGQASRSELDMLCGPLKALLLSQPHAQAWIRDALLGPTFPPVNAGVQQEHKTMFLRQLVATRGDTARIKTLVRLFWASCRGTVLSYGS